MEYTDFDRIFREYSRLVMKAAYSYIGDYQLCEDICQEVFEKLHREAKYIDPKDLKPWFLVVARTTALDYRKKLKMDKITLEPLETCQYEAGTEKLDPLHHVVDKENHREVIEALWEHDARDLELMIQVEIEGRTIKELAASRGTTPNNLRTKLYRIRKWLHEKFPDVEDYF